MGSPQQLSLPVRRSAWHPTTLSLRPKAGVALRIPVPGGNRDLQQLGGLTGCCWDPQPWLSQRLRSCRGDVAARGAVMPRQPGNCPWVVMHLLRKQSLAVAELSANQTPRPAVRGGPGQRLRPQQASRQARLGPARRRSGCSSAALTLG